MSDEIKKENVTPAALDLNSLQETFSSITSFFGVIYGIILTISICYNVGYFTLINPQFVELMGIGDYIDDTIHNIWLFLVAGLLFFGSSLAFVKNRIKKEMIRLVLFVAFTLIVCGFSFFQEMNSSQFWPAIKMLSNGLALFSLFIACAIMALFLFVFLIFKFTAKMLHEKPSPLFVSVIPIIMIFLLIIGPYLGGMIRGYI